MLCPLPLAAKWEIAGVIVVASKAWVPFGP